MILTGHEIKNRVKSGEIVLTPFLESNINPNSYNFRLSNKLLVYKGDVLDPRRDNEFEEIYIGDEGCVLEARKLYLAGTIEKMGSDYFVPTYAARSSVARLGMFINLSAPLGDIGFIGNWTIQLFPTTRVRVYHGMNIGQIMFWKPQGEIDLYKGKYQGAQGPVASRIHQDMNVKEKNKIKVA